MAYDAANARPHVGGRLRQWRPRSLTSPSRAGRRSVRRINPAHARAAAALVATLGADRATEVVQAFHDLSAALAQTSTQ